MAGPIEVTEAEPNAFGVVRELGFTLVLRDSVVTAEIHAEPWETDLGHLRSARDYCALGEDTGVPLTEEEARLLAATAERAPEHSAGLHNTGSAAGDGFWMRKQKPAVAESVDFRYWAPEQERQVIEAMVRHGVELAPRLLAEIQTDEGRVQVFRYSNGHPPSELEVSRMGTTIRAAMTRFQDQLAQVPRAALPPPQRISPELPLPPASDDIADHVRYYIEFEMWVLEKHRDRLWEKFAALGVPALPFAPIDPESFDPERPQLIHGDRTVNNMHLFEDRVTGIFDMELAMWGFRSNDNAIASPQPRVPVVPR